MIVGMRMLTGEEIICEKQGEEYRNPLRATFGKTADGRPELVFSPLTPLTDKMESITVNHQSALIIYEPSDRIKEGYKDQVRKLGAIMAGITLPEKKLIIPEQ